MKKLFVLLMISFSCTGEPVSLLQGQDQKSLLNQRLDSIKKMRDKSAYEKEIKSSSTSLNSEKPSTITIEEANNLCSCLQL